MRIVQINDNDINGKIYNGHDLQLSLNKRGIEAYQLVAEKFGDEETTISMLTEGERTVRRQLQEFEKRTGLLNILEPYADKFLQSSYFQNADIVHYHIIHNQVLSLFDLPKMMGAKPSVWSIHDPWIIGGHCIYPLDCEQWKSGCQKCEALDRPFAIQLDKSKDIWKLKQQIFKKINPDIIVSTDWMKSYLQDSPLTNHMTKIHKIPFGLKLEKYKNLDKTAIKREFDIPQNNIVISFRSDFHIVKGCQYIIEALNQIEERHSISILTVGTAPLPEDIKDKFHTVELGWQREEGVIRCLIASDIFLMTSLAESFGLMAIEAMAAKCVVIVFKETVLEQVTFSPQCGIAVPLKDSNALAEAIKRVINDSDERQSRSDLGLKIVEQNYKYKQYIDKHIQVYEEIMDREREEKALYSQYNNDVVEKIKDIKLFGKKINELSNGQAKKICIFCAGKFGKTLFFDLRDRMVSVDYFADNNSEKWGNLVIGEGSKSMVNAGIEEFVTRKVDFADRKVVVECISPSRLDAEKQETLVIVANKYPDEIFTDLKNKGFKYVVKKQDIDQLLADVPRADILGLGKFYGDELDELATLDYNNPGTQRLIKSLNRIIYGVCQYYEEAKID